jgi:hypothetical protein
MLSTLRRIRRLRNNAEAVIGKYKRYWNDLPSLAEDHLLRVITVFRYGEPRIDEPLARSYGRALSRLADKLTAELQRLPRLRGRRKQLTEVDCLHYLYSLLERETPGGDRKSTICTCVQQVPDWLRRLCNVKFSMRLLGLEAPPLSEDVLKLWSKSADFGSWPRLPEGILEPCPEYGEEQSRFLDKMSTEEELSFMRIYRKPEREWTRDERRFVMEMFARDSEISLLDKHD